MLIKKERGSSDETTAPITAETFNILGRTFSSTTQHDMFQGCGDLKRRTKS